MAAKPVRTEAENRNVMKRTVMSILTTCLLLLSGCERNELCYDHPHENLHVAVVWDSLPPDLHLRLPESVRISMYPASLSRRDGSDWEGGSSSGTGYTYYRGTYGGDITVQDGAYDFLLFNSDTEMIQLRGMDDIRTAQAYLEARTRAPYTTKAVTNTKICYSQASAANAVTRSETLMAEPDRLFATYCSRETVETYGRTVSDTIYAYPRSRVMAVTLTVKVQGLKGATSCRASLSGVVRSISLATGECTDETGTAIFDMEKTGDSFLSRKVHVFGLVQSPPDTPEEECVQHLVRLEFVMRDGTVNDYEVEVSDQINFNEVKPEVVIPIVIEDIELPEVDVPGTNGGFDAGVSNWGEEVEIILK